MKRALFLLLWAIPLYLVPLLASAHELRPASLQISQNTTEEFSVVWRVPARDEMRLALYVKFDQQTTPTSLTASTMVNGYYTESWSVSHPNSLLGSTIAIDGLPETMTDVLVRITWLDGREQVTRLMPETPQFIVEEKPGSTQIAATYFVLGVEHILLGFDHLLFVLALVLLVTGGKQLITTISAFTLAHSLTLAAAVLGLISLPQGPVEAVIALSIVFVAMEIMHKRQGRSTLAIRKPWLVAFGFGLLHGLGFAGALSHIGVPQHAIPISLALFNIGVEAGQLLFIAAVAGVMLLVRRLPPIQQWEVKAGTTATVAASIPVAYLVGGLASWWLIDRTVALII